ncbi:hypothetical protein BGZ65_010440, partial [Modicella reniformis]
MASIETPSNSRDTFGPHQHRVVATVERDKHVKGEEDFRNLSIGLAISSKGDQVAIYQEPKIGQWKNDTKFPECSFRIHLYNNPLAPKQHDITLDVGGDGNQTIAPHRVFDSFVGYGAFSTEMEDTLFVSCNGFFLNVFNVMPGKAWTHIRAIRLTDLTPTFSRRIMCKAMTETISGNTFMWLEDNGLCCTLWDLQEGSNVSYIFSTDNTRFSGSSFRSSSKMAISPDESIVVLARDNTLTTYYASNGIEISTR